MKIKTLIVDDEPLAREAIRDLLQTQPDFRIVGECETGRQSVEAILSIHPDLVLLDVQMPEMDGFQVIQCVTPQRMPLTIFVTAYDSYALKAFEMHALDYVLKPFEEERLLQALQRAKVYLNQSRNQEITDRLLELLRYHTSRSGVSSPTPAVHLERLVIRSRGRVLFLSVREVDWIQAEGSYVRLHLGNKSYVQRTTMGTLQQQLDSRHFVRIHRSTIVNIEHISEIKPWPTGEYVIIMRNGKELTLSRGYRDSLQLLLKGA